MDSDIL